MWAVEGECSRGCPQAKDVALEHAIAAIAVEDHSAAPGGVLEPGMPQAETAAHRLP
jgi:hypothetical protein